MWVLAGCEEVRSGRSASLPHQLPRRAGRESQIQRGRSPGCRQGRLSPMVQRLPLLYTESQPV